MSQKTITKGKLLKEKDVEIFFTLSDTPGKKPAKFSFERNEPPHPDLIKAFKSLGIHVAIICEYIPAAAIKDITKPDHENLKDFNVTGFTCVGEDEGAGVILSARKTLKTGKTMGINTPAIDLEAKEDGMFTYPFAEDLALCVATCKDELELYLGGKFAPEAEDPQGTLFLDEEKNVVHGEKKVRGRKKKNVELV